MPGCRVTGAGSSHSAERALLRTTLQGLAPAVLGYFERRVPDRQDAADCLAETMLQAWRRADQQPDDPTEARMWLFTIAANVLANQRRSGRRREALADRLRQQLTACPPVADLDLAEVIAVRDAVRRLPEEHRELVMLVNWDGLTLAEAAGVLGLNASTARGRYASARQALRDALTSESAVATPGKA